MKYLALTFKNIKKFILFHPVMFIFLIFAQIVCCMAVFISCGMAYNMNYVHVEKQDFKEFSFTFDSLSREGYHIDRDDNGNITESYPIGAHDEEEESSSHIKMPNTIPVKKAKAMIEELIERTSSYGIQTIILWIYPGSDYDTKDIPMLKIDSVYPGFIPLERWKGPPYLDTTEKVFFSPIYDLDGNLMSTRQYDIGDTANFNGVTYKCVADYDYDFIPYNVIPDDFVVSNVRVMYKPEMTEEDINSVVSSVEDIFNTEIKSCLIPEPYDPIELQFSRMLFVISIAVMLIVIFAISKFYSFVLSTRKDTLSILRMCGCTRGKANIVYMLEIMITMLFTTAAAFLLFKFVFFNHIAVLYPSFIDFYIPIVYIAVIGVYLVISFIIMTSTVVSATKNNIVNMIRNI